MKKLFNTRSTCLSSFQLKKFVFVFVFFLITSFSAMASHFRFGNVTWTNTGGNTVTFTIKEAWRLSAFSPVVLGGTVFTGNDATFYYGDGQFAYPTLTVTSIDSARDWFYGITTITYTYASAGTYTAGFSGCCRISTLQNNADGNFNVQTIVNVGAGNNSPVTSITPIIDLSVNDANASFIVPASEPDGQSLSFRLATDVEASGSASGYYQPAGLTINPATGRVSFPTTGLPQGQLYTTQIIISDGIAEVAVDFIIQTATNVGTAPYFAYPPTPADGTTIVATVGVPVNFNVEAMDNDSGDIVSLNAVGLPIGAVTTPVLPTTGNPVNALFSWTPTTADIGSYVVQYQATDNTGRSVTTNVIISVSSISTCDSTLKVHAAAVPRYTVKGQAYHTIYKGYGLQRLALFAAHSGGMAPYTYQWSDGATSYIHVVSPDTTTTYGLTITDAKGCTATCSITIYVVDVRCTTPGNIFVCNGGQTMSVPKADVQSWLDQGATLGSCNYVPLAAASRTTVSLTALKPVTAPAPGTFSIYPNPAVSSVTLKWNTTVTGSAKVVITDLQGRILMTQSVSGSSKTISVSQLASGVYMAKLVAANGTVATSRFIVSK